MLHAFQQRFKGSNLPDGPFLVVAAPFGTEGVRVLSSQPGLVKHHVLVSTMIRRVHAALK